MLFQISIKYLYWKIYQNQLTLFLINFVWIKKMTFISEFERWFKNDKNDFSIFWLYFIIFYILWDKNIYRLYMKSIFINCLQTLKKSINNKISKILYVVLNQRTIKTINFQLKLWKVFKFIWDYYRPTDRLNSSYDKYFFHSFQLTIWKIHLP